MGKFYLKALAVLLGMVAGTNAVAENVGMMTKAIYTYGELLEEGYSQTPTGVVRSFYDNHNRLTRVVEADIMLADNDQTLEVEVPGQEVPRIYSIYDYNENGTLAKVRTRKFGLYSGHDKAWTDFEDAETYEYDAEGKLVKKTDVTYITNYQWEDGKIVEEVAYYTKDNLWSNTIRYTAFDGEQPTEAMFSDKWGNNKIYVYEYVDGNQTKLQEYNVKNAERDENNALVKGEKGLLYKETTWTYGEDGELMEKVQGYWNSGKNSLDLSSKVEYVTEGDTTVISNFNYNINKEIWAKSGSTKKSVSGVVDNATSPTEMEVMFAKDVLNTLLLTAKAPAEAENEGWKVYRNGMIIGEAVWTDGVLSYADSLVTNGVWDYFIQHGDDNTSAVIEVDVHTALPAVQGVKVVKNSLNVKGEYELTFSWSKPEAPMEVLGYNVYFDIRDYETNPVPENGTELIPVGVAEYTFVQPTSYVDADGNAVKSETEHQVYVETVYRIGKVKSQAITMNLQEEETVPMVKAIMTLGDVMSNSGGEAVTKAEVYYYDHNKQLARKMIYGKMLGEDDMDPDKLYQIGDWIPITYTAYTYNDKGQLVQTRERQYGHYSGYNMAWSEFGQIGACVYDEAGKLKADTIESRVYSYQYEGDNLVMETYANVSGSVFYQKKFSDFVAGLKNCPQYAFSNSPEGVSTSYNRIYEYTYDEEGNMLTCHSYKYLSGSEVKDENGYIVSAEKGTPDREEIWTYDNGILVKYEKNKWNTSKEAYIGELRSTYTLTPMGVKKETSRYSAGVWAKGGTPQVTWEVPFDGVAPTGLTVAPVEGKVNTVKLTAKKPDGVTNAVVWNVFRNGVKIGEASNSGRYNIVYEDVEVPNGHWDYFIQAEDSHGPVGVNISNVVETDIYTELPAVTDIQVVSNAFNDVKDYEVVLEWKAPETTLPIKGYNMFVDMKAITKNPSPVNGIHCFEQTQYTYTAANDVNPNKTFVVETVYNIGKAKSEALAVVLQKEADGVGRVTVDNLLLMMDRMLLVNGEYLTLDIYSIDGAKVGSYMHTPRIDLSALPVGVYVVKIMTEEGGLTGKISVK